MMPRSMLRTAGMPLLLLLCVCRLAAQMPELYDEWRWVRFDLNSGLSSLQIINILEPLRGTPWVHTRNSIEWYDGFEWQKAAIDSVQPADISRGTITADSNGVLFVLPPAVYRVSQRGATRLPATWHGSPLVVRKAAMLPGRAVMLQSDTALYLFRGDTTVLLPSPFQHPMVHTPDHPFGLFQTGNGAVWLNTPTGLFRWMGGAWRCWYATGDDDYLTILAIAEAPEGYGAASARLNIKQVRIEWDRTGAPRAEVMDPGDAMLAMDIAPNGALLARHNSGVLSVRLGDRWHQLDPPPMQMLNALALRFRPNGDLWVGKESGLFLCAVSSQRWTLLDNAFPPETKTVNELLLAPDSTLWVGTGDGILQYHSGAPARHIERINNMRLHVVTGLARDRQDNIWIASGASFEGAYRWDGSTWKHFGLADGLGARRVHRIHRDRAGKLWFLSINAEYPGLHPESENGAYYFDDGRFTRVGVKEGLLDNRVYAFAEDSSGAYWFGTLTGLSRWKDGRWKYWTHNDGLISDRVWTLAVDTSGRVWFGHQLDGLGYIDGDERPRYVTTAEGVTSRSVWEIKAGSDGKIWVATRDGLFVNNHGFWAMIGTAQGLPNPYLWPLLVTPDRVYIGTTGSGVAVLDQSTLNTPPPRVKFTEQALRGSAEAIGWEVVAPWELIPSSSMKTRYRLDDQPWSEWSEQRSVTLGGMSVGSHTLAVQAKGIIGQVARIPQTTTFEVQPPFVFRPMFYLPVGVLFGLLVTLAVVFVRRRREYRRTLREQDARFRAVVEHQTELILRLLPDGSVSFVNEACCSLLQQPRSKLVGQQFTDLMATKDTAESFAPLLRADPGGKQEEVDRQFSSPDGAQRWLRWTSNAIAGDDAVVSEIQLIGRDITERKAAEERLVRGEERYRVVAEQTGQLVYDYDIRTGAITWAGAIQKVTGFTAEEFQSITVEGWKAMIHEADREVTAQELDRCIASGSPFEITYRLRHKSGTYVDIFDNGILLVDAGKSVRMLGAMTDITERRRAEAQIAASLKEKEVLLKEIHHRVKNNLQVISSLLSLQATNVEDKKTLEQLRESQNRIRSMALIHERLYQSNDLARINFAEYVRGLIGFLARSYNVPSVRVNVNLQNIDLPVNSAIPCGLILNELVSNALKYAFPDGRRGEVEIRLATTSDGYAVLSVIDDGVGLPGEIDVQNTATLGLQLVSTLAKQLNGTIGLVRDGGTAFSVSFPVEA